MTRARALKRTIRARAARTGERYTTARRHLLNDLDRPVERAAPPVPEAVTARQGPPGSSPKGGISDDRVRERTGHELTHWFDLLDAFGGIEKGHTAAARHLHAAHGVDGWYAQGITVAYERARGVRLVNQRRSGEFEVSVSKVVPGDLQSVVAALSEPRQRKVWMGNAPAEVVREFVAALTAETSNGFVVRPTGQGRFRYKTGGAVVEFYLEPKPGGKVSIVVQNSKLPALADVEERRGRWKEALSALAAHLKKTGGPTSSRPRRSDSANIRER